MLSSAVLILYNEPRGSRADTPVINAESDAGVLAEVAQVGQALTDLGVGYRTVSVRSLRDVGRTLAASPEPCIVNLVESLDGSADDACAVPAVCTALGKACTGSDTGCQLLALDKWQSKCALRAAGVPVPDAVVVPPGIAPAPGATPAPPIIVKPLCADASEGIDAGSVLTDPTTVETLGMRVRGIHQTLNQAALVEQYVDGRELNVSILERKGELTVLPLAEIDFSAFAAGKPRIVDYRAKWIEDSFEFINTPRRIPADIDDATAQRVRDVARAAWKCLGCRDYARIDMRLSAAGEPFVIEVNPNPDISPDAGFAAALQAGGICFADFIRGLLENAGLALTRPSATTCDGKCGDGLQVQWSLPRERDAILELVEATGVFRSHEIDVAREVLDDALAAGQGGHYQSYTALVDGNAVGWACFGPAPCTSGTFELYWLAVSPACRGRGVGRALLGPVEASVRSREGRRIVVETSSRSEYAPAHHFYQRHGYRKVSTVPDFYEDGDDKLIYAKTTSGEIVPTG